MTMRFDGRTAIVTGGASGIGAATARLLCELGARVAILDANAQLGEEYVATLRKLGHNATLHYCDVGSLSEVQTAVDAVESALGPIQLLVSNAGIQRYGNAVNTTLADWEDTLRVHVQGCFNITRSVIPSMLRAGGGSIVVVGSVQTFTAVSNSIAYVTAKHALQGIVRSIALDFASRNIRANCVLPAAIDTPMLRWAAELSGDAQSVLDTCARMHALRRVGLPEEVAQPIAFLLSDWASFITGSSLLVDGGMTVPTGGMAFSESGTGASAC